MILSRPPESIMSPCATKYSCIGKKEKIYTAFHCYVRSLWIIFLGSTKRYIVVGKRTFFFISYHKLEDTPYHALNVIFFTYTRAMYNKALPRLPLGRGRGLDNDFHLPLGFKGPGHGPFHYVNYISSHEISQRPLTKTRIHRPVHA